MSSFLGEKWRPGEGMHLRKLPVIHVWDSCDNISYTIYYVTLVRYPCDVRTREDLVATAETAN